MRIVVLGLGPSSGMYKHREGDYVIGVNDAMRLHDCDCIVVLDKPERFTAERLEWIMKAKVLFVYELVYHLYKNHCSIAYFGTLSNNTPFVALLMAINMFQKDEGYNEIQIYGADFYGHPNLGHPAAIAKARKDFERLKGIAPISAAGGLTAEIFGKIPYL
jgi:hypothetical protein